MDGQANKANECQGCRQLEREVKELRKQLDSFKADLKKLKKDADSKAKAKYRQANKFARPQTVENPKPPGRKRGTLATPRPQPERIDREFEVPAGCCPDCNCQVTDVEIHEQLQTDIPRVEPTVTRFHVEVGHCPNCGRRVQGRHAEQTSDALGAANNHLGPNVQALGSELKNRFGLSFEKVSELMREVFNLRVARSSFYQFGRRLMRRAEPSINWLRDEVLRRAHVVHADETGWRVGRKSSWLWVFSTPQATLYQIANRSGDVARGLLGEDFNGILCTDGFCGYDSLPYLKSQCVGHILRRIHDLKQSQPPRQMYYLEELQQIFQDALDWRSAAIDIASPTNQRVIADIEKRLDGWLSFYGTQPTVELHRLANHIARHRSEWLMFLYDPQVPATNNHAERMIRPAVILRKTTGCHRSSSGAEVHESLSSLIVTCRQQGQSSLEVMRQLLVNPRAAPADLFPSLAII